MPVKPSWNTHADNDNQPQPSKETTMRLSESEFSALIASNPDLHPPAPVERKQRIAPTPSEHEEQVALFAWKDANMGQWPELRTMFAIPNGGARAAVVGKMLKQEGVCAGVPDICLPVQRRGPDGRSYGCMFIELKRADHSNNPTPLQKAWLDMLRAEGQFVIVCYGADDAIRAITTYLGHGSPV